MVVMRRVATGCGCRSSSPSTGSSKALAMAKARVNQFGRPTATEIESSNDMFFATLASPGAQARRAKVRSIGYGVPSDFELNFGRYLPALGRAGDDDTDTRPD